jgi:hypothetical protein
MPKKHGEEVDGVPYKVGTFRDNASGGPTS